MKNKAHYEWQKKNTILISFRLNLHTDADIVAALDGKNKQQEIRRLLRKSIASELLEAHNDD